MHRISTMSAYMSLDVNLMAMTTILESPAWDAGTRLVISVFRPERSLCDRLKASTHLGKLIGTSCSGTRWKRNCVINSSKPATLSTCCKLVERLKYALRMGCIPFNLHSSLLSTSCDMTTIRAGEIREDDKIIAYDSVFAFVKDNTLNM